jgi:hypothetical protein
MDAFEVVKVILWDGDFGEGGGGKFGLGDNYGYYVTLNVYKSPKFCNYPKLAVIGPFLEMCSPVKNEVLDSKF